ncbi:MAG TPA: CHAT domain-containing protein [Anaerolineae bacterium]|nr:CHAT domain-containing protein [Anaerolineae bacterium]HNU05731.1 CHAT domain-containing protein [Anaerolineae bacterium]
MEPSFNFDLQLTGGLTGVIAEVLDSPAGQTAAASTRPLAVDLAGLDGAAPTARLAATGLGLWRSVFGAPAIAELWRASLARVEPDGVLRLRLATGTPALAALPWELLYDETLGRFLALDGRTPVTRFVRLPIAPAPWPQDRPLRLLFTGASPSDLFTLDVAGEWQEIARAVAPVVADGRVQTTSVAQGATLADLLSALRRGVDLWHFAGHGTDHGLIFCDARGRAELVEAGILGELLAGEGVRLAVLNACRAGAGGGQAASVAGALVRAGVPAVIALQGDITSAAAEAFAAAFYDAIAAGQGADRAVTAARKAIRAAGTAEWWLPTLFMRTADGRIWQEPKRERPPATAPHVAVQGDRNIVIAGTVGGNVTIHQSDL